MDLQKMKGFAKRAANFAYGVVNAPLAIITPIILAGLIHVGAGEINTSNMSGLQENMYGALLSLAMLVVPVARCFFYGSNTYNGFRRAFAKAEKPAEAGLC